MSTIIPASLSLLKKLKTILYDHHTFSSSSDTTIIPVTIIDMMISYITYARLLVYDNYSGATHAIHMIDTSIISDIIDKKSNTISSDGGNSNSDSNDSSSRRNGHTMNEQWRSYRQWMDVNSPMIIIDDQLAATNRLTGSDAGVERSCDTISSSTAAAGHHGSGARLVMFGNQEDMGAQTISWMMHSIDNDDHTISEYNKERWPCRSLSSMPSLRHGMDRLYLAAYNQN